MPGALVSKLLEEAKVRNLVGPACARIMVTAENPRMRSWGRSNISRMPYLIKPVTAALLENELEKIWTRKGCYGNRSGDAGEEFSAAVALCDQRLQYDRANAGELQRLKSQILLNAGESGQNAQVYEQVLAERRCRGLKPGWRKRISITAITPARDLLQQTIEENRTYLKPTIGWCGRSSNWAIPSGGTDAGKPRCGCGLNSPLRRKSWQNWR